ncbi:MAG TPA: MG2 domain-containing protein, partial [Kofleriaceae bacterium]
MTRLRFAFVSVALVITGACGGKKSQDKPKPATGSAAGSGSDAEVVDVDAPPKLELTAKKLAPVIQVLRTDETVPSAITVQLATPIIDRNRVRGTSPKSKLTITPEIAGTLTYGGPAELRFVPMRPFEFDTAYTVKLEAVETTDKVISPGAGDKWTYSFRTPKFAFLGWAPSEIDAEKLHRVTMELRFSGAVLPNLARNAMTITIDGKPTGGALVQPGRQPDIVSIQITDPRIVPGAKIAMAITKALPSLTNTAKISSGTAEYTVTKDKAVSIKAVSVVEGANGVYLEVICDDDAATTGNRSFYEGESYNGLSQRCQLPEEALARVQFDPPIKKAYMTAGRAGFRVFGEFKRGAYSIKIPAGVKSVDGGILYAPFSRSFAVPARKAQLSFAASGRYLPRSAWSNLGIKHMNVETVNLVVRHVPAENLVFWLGNEGTDQVDDRTGDVILKKTIQLRNDGDVAGTTWLDVASLLPATTKGVLELKLVGVGTKATSRLLLTNMSLVAKKTAVPKKPWLQTVNVWALGMENASALDGVEVSLVRKSGKSVAKCKTSGPKGCVLTVEPDKDPDQGVPFVLIAKKGDDLTYIRYEDLRGSVTDSGTSGTPFVADAPYRAAIFADRGVYRPGDTAHITAIIRDAKNLAPDKPLPIDAKIIDPRAKVVRKLALKTNPGGLVVIDHALPAFADTGHWRVQLSVADKPLAGHDIQVEEFVPERMRVTIAPKQEDAQLGTKVALDVSAQYLFGGSALDSGVDLNCSIEPTEFAPEENSDLTYGVEVKGKSIPLGSARGQLDPNGRLTLACPDNPAAASFNQTAQLNATASVLEAGSGRATVKSTTATLHPERFYLGLKTKASQALAGKPFKVEGLVVDWAGKPNQQNAPAKVAIELIHLEGDYGYSYDEDTGESRYDRWLRRVPEGKQGATVVGGKFSFDVTPGNADAGYVVRVTAGKATTELVMDGENPYGYYGYGNGDHQDATPRPARATQLKLTLPKEIKVGEQVAAKVKTPYKGKILWTVETDKVIAAEWREATAAGEQSWAFKLAEFAPNVYVSAFLVKDPHLESKDAFLPDRAFGIDSVRVTPSEYTQTVTLDVPKEIRSNSPLKVTLNLGANAGPTFATVAVVDEGILSLTDFKTPEPLAQLFARRGLGVETFETIGWTMLHQAAGASSKTGGGDDYDSAAAESGGGPLEEGRIQPVKPVALFSGIVQVGADGRATIPFQIPTYRGQVRVMAFTAGSARIGRAEAKVTVKDPLVVQTTFPRFVTQNDELQIPVFLNNLSGGPLEISVKLESSALPVAGLAAPKNAVAPLGFAGKDTGTIKLENGRADTVVFQAKANMPLGGAKLRVVARGKGPKGSFEAIDELDVPFLPAGPKERVVQKFKVAAGPLDLAAKATAMKGWVPTSERTTFWLTSNPYGESFEHLKYLIQYPYGCIEQTVSSSRPLLYAGSLVEQIDPELAQYKIEDMVISGINRVLSMETASGGFGYWPGATEPLEWGTAYAMHFLLDAKKAGYAVPDDRMKEVLAWIENRVAQHEAGSRIRRDKWNYYDEQAEAYLHYVLAVAGKGKKGRVLALIGGIPANAKGEQAEDLYMLKAALYLAGDRRYEKDLKAVDASPVKAERVNSWSFYSDRRRRGLMLSTFHDLFGNDAKGEVLAQRVADSLVGQASYYYNTQELVWGVTGLGKWVKAAGAKGVAAGTLVADGTTIPPRATKQQSSDKTWTLGRASEYKALTIDIPQSAAGMWLVVRSEGVRPGNTYKVGGNGLAINRTYRSLDGAEIDVSKPDTLALGD